MTGRGVDQVLPHSCPPQLHEFARASALDYVELAEALNGPIPRPVDYSYVWGDALEVLARERPDARIINLETSLTTSEDVEPKGINYRMHPANVPLLAAAGVSCCALANNHVLDWGRAGLLETLDTLQRANIPVAGAGRNLAAAEAPAVLDAGAGSRILVFSFGMGDSGIPVTWAAGADEPGLHRPDYSEEEVERIARLVAAHKLPGDVVVASVHLGGNWGYQLKWHRQEFARALVERAGIDVFHGHSSHHPKAIEIYRDRPILYGCGDFLNDYEGIQRAEYLSYRHDLVLMYFVTLGVPSGRLVRLRMVPLQIRQFRLRHVSEADREWVRIVMDRECRRFGRGVTASDDVLTLGYP